MSTATAPSPSPVSAPGCPACTNPFMKYFAPGLIVGLVIGLFGGVFAGPLLENWTTTNATVSPAPSGRGAMPKVTVPAVEEKTPAGEPAKPSASDPAPEPKPAGEAPKTANP